MLAEVNKYIADMDYDFSYKTHVRKMIGIYKPLIQNQDVGNGAEGGI